MGEVRVRHPWVAAMVGRVLFSVVESPAHPDCGVLCRRLGLDERRFSSMRKAIGALKRTPPDFVIADFFYGYGNNYAGVNVSNLDVFLASLQRYAPEARVLVLAQPAELGHVDKLAALFRIHVVRALPVAEDDLVRFLAGDPLR